MIEQMDRDAAAAFFRDERTGLSVKFNLGHDPSPLLEVLAAHRQAAYAAGMEQAAEIAAAEGMPWAGLREGVMFARLAAAIRAEKDNV